MTTSNCVHLVCIWSTDLAHLFFVDDCLRHLGECVFFYDTTPLGYYRTSRCSVAARPAVPITRPPLSLHPAVIPVVQPDPAASSSMTLPWTGRTVSTRCQHPRSCLAYHRRWQRAYCRGQRRHPAILRAVGYEKAVGSLEIARYASC